MRPPRQGCALAHAVEHGAADAVVGEPAERHAAAFVEPARGLEQALLSHRAQVVELDGPTELALDGPIRFGSSLLLGVALAVVLIASTRVAVERWNWARRLHADLRPVAKNLTLPSIVIIASMSSLGEELFFRGFLTPFFGGI